MQYRPEIQLDMFSITPALSSIDGEVLSLMRPHRWANKVDGELPLVEVRLKSHGARWMWGISLCSRNGAGQGYAPLPKRGKFAASREAAIDRAVEEIRVAMERATSDERQRIVRWCGEILGSVN